MVIQLKYYEVSMVINQIFLFKENITLFIFFKFVKSIRAAFMWL